MKQIRSSSAALIAILGLATLSPVAAQDVADGETIRQQTVYGDDECGKPSSDDEIVVCVKMDESERFRVPEILRGDPNAPESQAWATKIESIQRISRFGTQSCSPAGLGGFTGCTTEMINAAVAANRADANVDWTKAIAAERQKRIDAIDANARDAEQAYVRQEETKEAREAQMAAARARLAAGETADTPPAEGDDDDLAVPPGAEESPE